MADPRNPYLPSGLDRLSTMLMALGAGVSGAEARGQSGWAGLGPAAAMYGAANTQANQQALQYDQWDQARKAQEEYRKVQEENLRSQMAQREAQGQAKAGMTQGVLSALGGGAPPGFGQYSPQPTIGPGGDILARASGAIAGIESGGQADPYMAIGPQTAQGRANGKYQVMDFNVGPWTKEILGQEMTPEQFRANPQAQEAVFKGKFGQYLQKTGNPQDAASMWFSGRPLAGNTAGPDVNGTTVAGYVNKFNRGMGGPGGAAPPNAQGQGDAAGIGVAEPQLDPQTVQMIRAIAINDPTAAAKLMIEAKSKLKKEDAFQPLTEGDAKMLLGPGFDASKAYQRNRLTGKIEAIGGSLVNINNQQESEMTKAIAKQDAERLLKIQENATTINDTANKVRLAADLFKQTYTGTGGDAANFFFKTLGSLGVESAANKANAASAATALISEMMPKMRAPGSGATSDFEMRTFAAALPSLLSLPDGNEMISTYWQRIADRAMAIQSIAEKHVGESKALTGTKYAEEVKALGPLFSKEELAQMKQVASSAPKDRPPLGQILNGSGQPQMTPMPVPQTRPPLGQILGR